MDSKLPVINIDSLHRDVGKIVVNEEEHLVKPINGVCYHALRNAKSDQEQIEAAYAIVAHCVPTLSPELCERLDVRQVGAIVMLVVGRVEDLEQAFPNGERPTTTSSSPA